MFNLKSFIYIIWSHLGYPRNMRDTGEYLESVGRLDGVIYLNWKEETLAKQVGRILDWTLS